MKTTLIVSISIAAVFLLLAFVVPISYRNSSAKAETLVINAEQDCASTYDNGMKSMIENAQVDANTKQFLSDLFNKQSTNYHKFPGGAAQAQQVQDAYGQALNGGDTAKLFLMLSGIAGTNLTATSTNVQREITSQRAQMLTCSKALNASQRELRNILGMDASGRVIAFPQSWLHMDLPSEISDPVLRDNDGDGKLTVLDYRPPVDINIRNSFGTGEGLPPVNLYGTQTP